MNASAIKDQFALRVIIENASEICKKFTGQLLRKLRRKLNPLAINNNEVIFFIMA